MESAKNAVDQLLLRVTALLDAIRPIIDRSPEWPYVADSVQLSINIHGEINKIVSMGELRAIVRAANAIKPPPAVTAAPAPESTPIAAAPTPIEAVKLAAQADAAAATVEAAVATKEASNATLEAAAATVEAMKETKP